MRKVVFALIYGLIGMSLIAGLMSMFSTESSAQEADRMGAPFVINSFVDKARLSHSPREGARAQHYARLAELNRSILENAPHTLDHSRQPAAHQKLAPRNKKMKK